MAILISLISDSLENLCLIVLYNYVEQFSKLLVWTQEAELGVHRRKSEAGPLTVRSLNL